MDNYKVYKYTNIINGKVYIGRTKMTLTQRSGHNGYKYLKLKYFGAAIKKYGWDNFIGEILEDGLTYDECCEKEKYYIQLYDSCNPEKGYNLAKGGEGPTKEALFKMSESHKNKHLSEEHKKHISESLGKGANNKNYGRKHSAEFCKKMHENNSGENHPNWGKHLKDSTKKKIKKAVGHPCLQYDLEGNFIREWDDSLDAANELGLNHKAINNCLRCMRHSSGGFIWKYKDPDLQQKYADNLYILENFGIRSFAKKEELLLKRDKNINQETTSTTIPEMGVE